ncbi:MAG: DHH family phosphoesterase [Clostridia bacterium]|nr:DHH family phosphoesterase [Clostridia bacterium]
MKVKALFYQNIAGFSASLVLLVMTVTAFFFDRSVGIALAVAFIVSLVLGIIYSAFSLKATIKYVSAVNKTLVNGEGDGVDAFPLPAVMCDKAGNIVWYNQQFFEDVVDTYDIRTLTINDFLDDFSFSDYCDKKICNASFAENEYTAFVVKVNSATRPMLCFYFFDDTAYKTIQREFVDTRPFVMMLLIDNIEQMSRYLTDSRLASVLGSIEAIIEKWLEDEAVVLKRVGNGSYLVVGEKRNLDSMIADKFSILTKVRELKFEERQIEATLSIGVGTGESLRECEARAKKSLEMALSRGGDQTAVYGEDGYIYFGGVSNKTNESSRVSPRQTSANVASLLKQYKRAIVLGHKYSDYDAIGAAMGMCFFAQSLGLEASVVVDGRSTLASPLVAYAVENGFDSFITPSKAEDLTDDDTVVIVVDTQRKKLLDSSDVYDLAGATVVIDHHRRSDDYLSDADILYSSPTSSSACELVAELIQYSSIQDNVPMHVATALLSGIVLDTKDFVLRTSQRTFEAAGFLKDYGADTIKVRRLFSIDPEMASVKNEIIANSKMHSGFMVGCTSSDSRNIRIITSNAADDMLNIDGVKASFVISKQGVGKYQVSARSLGDENVQLVMEYLGGGGHSTMAAAQIKASSIENAREKVVSAINEYVKNK